MQGWNSFNVNNIPVGVYRINAKLRNNGQITPLRLEETGSRSSLPFGIEPKATRGQATLAFRPNGAKAEQAPAQHGYWDSLNITLKK